MDIDSSLHPSRQKSCDACVRSKRKCDKRTPRCTRCAERNVPCVYQNLPSTSSRDGEAPQQIEVGSMGLPAADFEDMMTDLQMDGTSQTTASSLENISPDLVMERDTSTAQLDLAFDYPILNFLSQQNLGGEMSMELWHNTASPKEPQLVPYAGLDVRDIQNKACPPNDACDFEVWDLYKPNSKAAYLVRTLSNFADDFARTKQTAWLHRNLYENAMPRTILTAFTTCVMYVNRTKANKAWVFRSIIENSAALQQVEPNTPHEKLARLQAMFLYQTIRTFDGDITLRAQAERDMPIFQRWADDLCEMRDNLAELAILDNLTAKERLPRSWDQWIFNECVRRIIILAYAFGTFYQVLKGGEDAEKAKDEKTGPWATIHRWTVSRYLWDAETSMRFFTAWREKPQYIVESFTLVDSFRFLRPEDVDEFTRILLAGHIGEDEINQFMGNKAPIMA